MAREVPFADCVICSGARGRERRSAGAATCKHNSCGREYARRRTVGQDSEQEDAPAPSMRCYEVKEVIGVSLCQISAMSDRERRAGRKRGAHDIYCEVRGGFGEDKDDSFTPDTRWVLLSELVKTIGPEKLTELNKFAKALKTTLTEAQQKLEEEEAEDE